MSSCGGRRSRTCSSSSPERACANEGAISHSSQNELRLAFRDKQVLFFNYAVPADLLLPAVGDAARRARRLDDRGDRHQRAGDRDPRQRLLRRRHARRRRIASRTSCAGSKSRRFRPLPILWRVADHRPAAVLARRSCSRVGLARVLYGMPIPDRPISLIVFLAIGALAFRSIGLIVAAVSNSMAESNVLVQLLYMPMMFLSGAAIPAAMLPRWTQTVAQFMPASYLVSGMQGILTQHESLARNWQSAGALLITLVPRDLRRDAPVPLGEGREAERLGEALGGRRDGAVPGARRLSVPHQRADGQEPDAVAAAAARRRVPDPQRAGCSSATAASSRTDRCSSATGADRRSTRAPAPMPEA